MWVEQLPSGRHRAVFRLPSGGKRSRTFDYGWQAEEWATAAEAAAWDLAAEGVAAVTGTPAPASARPTPTVAARGEAWLRRKADKATQTRSGYATHLRAIAAADLGAMPMGSVRRDDVLDWRADQLDDGVGAATINARLKVLRMIYRDAAANLIVDHDPTHDVALLTTGARPDRILTGEEQAALVAAADDQLADMVLVALHAGLRWQEVAALPASAVIGDYIHVRQVLERSRVVRTYTKGARGEGHRGRIVPVATDELAAALARRVAATPDPDGLLFTAPDGGPIDYYNWRRRVWRPALRAAKLNPRPRFHDLRHTYASTLAAAGVARVEIAKLLGHADEGTTGRYIHEGDDGRRRDLVRGVFNRKATPPPAAPTRRRHLTAVPTTRKESA
jgi:integrase